MNTHGNIGTACVVRTEKDETTVCEVRTLERVLGPTSVSEYK